MNYNSFWIKALCAQEWVDWGYKDLLLQLNEMLPCGELRTWKYE